MGITFKAKTTHTDSQRVAARLLPKPCSCVTEEGNVFPNIWEQDAEELLTAGSEREEQWGEILCLQAL